jgi:hypothetical protein
MYHSISENKKTQEEEREIKMNASLEVKGETTTDSF